MSKHDKKMMMAHKGQAGGIYFLAYIGAAIHFVSVSNGFWNIILALLKAAVWPAFLVNKVFTLLRI